MSNLSELIQSRLEEIANECSSLEESLRKSPEGKLRVSSSRNKPRFYLGKENESHQGRYLKKSEQELAMKLAQKDYDKFVLELLRKEEKVLSKAAHYYESAVGRITGKGKASGIRSNTEKASRKSLVSRLFDYMSSQQRFRYKQFHHKEFAVL